MTKHLNLNNTWGKLKDFLMYFGSQHPSTYDVLRLIITLSGPGNFIKSVEVHIIGLLHRGTVRHIELKSKAYVQALLYFSQVLLFNIYFYFILDFYRFLGLDLYRRLNLNRNKVGKFVNRFSVKLNSIIARKQNGFMLRCRFFLYNNINTIIILLFNCIAFLIGLDTYITPDQLGLLPQPKLVLEVRDDTDNYRPDRDEHTEDHTDNDNNNPPPNNNYNNLFRAIFSFNVSFVIVLTIGWLTGHYSTPIECESGDFKISVDSGGITIKYEPGAEKLPENLLEIVIETDQSISNPDGEEKLSKKK